MRIGVIAALLTITALTYAQDLIVQVYVNGKLQKYDPPARVRAGITYVPLRQGAASLGFSCEWLADQNAAKICDESGCMLIRKHEGIVVNGSMFLPLRKMGEAFGAKVTWDPTRRAVIIEKAKSKPKFE